MDRGPLGGEARGQGRLLPAQTLPAVDQTTRVLAQSGQLIDVLVDLPVERRQLGLQSVEILRRVRRRQLLVERREQRSISLDACLTHRIDSSWFNVILDGAKDKESPSPCSGRQPKMTRVRRSGEAGTIISPSSGPQGACAPPGRWARSRARDSSTLPPRPVP